MADARHAAVPDEPHSAGEITGRMKREIETFDVSLPNTQLRPKSKLPVGARQVVVNGRRDRMVGQRNDVTGLPNFGR